MTAHDIRRQERINKIVATLKDAKEKGKTVNQVLLVDECCMDWGCTRRTVYDYISFIDSKLRLDALDYDD